MLKNMFRKYDVLLKLFIATLSTMCFLNGERTLAFQAASSQFENEDVGPEKEDFGGKHASIMKALKMNAAAIQSGDVLICLDQEFDTVSGENLLEGTEFLNSKGATTFQRIWIRLIFDFNKMRFLVVSRKSESSISVQMGRLETPEVISSFIVSQSRFDFRSTNSGRLDVEVSSIKKTLPEDFPDFRAFGITATNLQSLESMEARLVQAMSGLDFTNAIVDEKSRKLIWNFSLPSAPGEKLILTSEIEFDNESLLPTKSRSYSRDKSGFENFGSLDEFDWENHDGVYVPRRGYSKSPRLADTEKGKLPFFVHSNARFHWFSVNETLEDDVFDEGQFKSTDDLLKKVSESSIKEDPLFNSDANDNDGGLKMSQK